MDSQGAYRNGKEFEICTTDLEFESGCASLVRAWNSWGFTPSPEPTKCAFWGNEVSSNPKKKNMIEGLTTLMNFLNFLFEFFYFYVRYLKF